MRKSWIKPRRNIWRNSWWKSLDSLRLPPDEFWEQILVGIPGGNTGEFSQEILAGIPGGNLRKFKKEIPEGISGEILNGNLKRIPGGVSGANKNCCKKFLEIIYGIIFGGNPMRNFLRNFPEEFQEKILAEILRGIHGRILRRNSRSSVWIPHGN